MPREMLPKSLSLFLFFLADTCPIYAPLVPPFSISGDVSYWGLKPKWGTLFALWRRMWCTSPEIHLWCYTCQPLDSQHGGWLNYLLLLLAFNFAPWYIEDMIRFIYCLILLWTEQKSDSNPGFPVCDLNACSATDLHLDHNFEEVLRFRMHIPTSKYITI